MDLHRKESECDARDVLTMLTIFVCGPNANCFVWALDPRNLMGVAAGLTFNEHITIKLCTLIAHYHCLLLISLPLPLALPASQLQGKCMVTASFPALLLILAGHPFVCDESAKPEISKLI